ncbi:exosortase-associated EpsI family protein [Puniceicoccus vermicola]|uniref:Exosortase-associated EpsI family protein n=1 Tax=Puniceicoccus vermicola TaxID=388746 RepID=A0A7X1AY17_9BACT|nr:exosortase-associated EpsI family protein [Puniceicoccus vermicola]MBC2600930.1 exosortase-associated EpsI family protein [Puniceicoccus vermicola]
MKKIFPFLGFAVLAVLIVFNFYNPFTAEVEEGRGAHVGEYVPSELTGWSVKDKKLGETESVEARAASILDLDDFVYRNFSRKGGEEFFEVYVAYWSPGSASIVDVNAHTPDRCWTKNGWDIVNKEHRVENMCGDDLLLPAEKRTFEIQGNEQYVYFWHLVGGEAYEYGKRTNQFPTPYAYVRDFLKSKVLGTGEQYFIRINTNIPLDTLWRNNQFQEVLADLSGLGLTMEKDDVNVSS